MKIILTTYSGSKRFFDMYIPDPGIAQIAGVLKSMGVDVYFFDLNIFGNTFAMFLSYCRKIKPDVIGFKFFDTGFRGVIQLARIIKNELPDTLIVGAGPHVTLFREHIYHQTEVFDLLAVGEGERFIVKLMDYLNKKCGIESIPNVIYKKCGQIITNHVELVEDLDTLPMPEWSVLNLERYFPLFLLSDHRGCYNTCSFCVHNYLWGYKLDCSKPGAYVPIVRQKSLTRLQNEIEEAYYRYGVRLFGFTDSIPVKERLLDFANYIIASKKKIYWTSFAMINQFDGENFKRFKESGCESLWIGVESGDSEILNRMNKNYTREDVIQTFKHLEEAGINGVPGFIIGFPGETIGSLKNTMSLIEEIGTETCVISPYILDPGSPIALNPGRYGVQLQKDWECKIILRDDLNEFEIPYYKVNGRYNNEIWGEFEAHSNYRGWDADRNIAESEYAYVIAAALGIPIDRFIEMFSGALNSTNPYEIDRIIQAVWKSTI